MKTLGKGKISVNKNCKNCSQRIAQGIDGIWYHVSPLGSRAHVMTSCEKAEPIEEENDERKKDNSLY
jgi:hypothetical protein